jgi:hypothetical protein
MTWDLPTLLPIREDGVLRIFIALKNTSPWPGNFFKGYKKLKLKQLK